MTHEIRAGATVGRADLVHRRELGTTITQAERIAEAEFDRWLAQQISQAETRGAKEAFVAARREVLGHPSVTTWQAHQLMAAFCDAEARVLNSRIENTTHIHVTEPLSTEGEHNRIEREGQG